MPPRTLCYNAFPPLSLCTRMCCTTTACLPFFMPESCIAARRTQGGNAKWQNTLLVKRLGTRCTAGWKMGGQQAAISLNIWEGKRSSILLNC